MNTLDVTATKPVILVAEDDPDQSDWLRDALVDEGYAVETVYSGDVALRRLTTRKFLVAIMDARMPGLHGGTVLKICSQKDSKSCTPIIIVSAFASPFDLEQYRKDGAAASFSKPLNISDVIKIVKQIGGDNLSGKSEPIQADSAR